jgi:PAS domain S-box-containing protein
LIQATVRDNTDRKNIEETLRKSETRFRNLLQDIPSVAVQGYAPDGTTQYWNRASEQLYGYTAAEAIGRKLTDLIIPPEMRPDVRKAIRFMAATGQTIPSSELSLMRKDGSRVAVFSSHAIVQVPGRPQELFCLDVDLTGRKEAEEELRRSQDNLKIAFDAAALGPWHWDIVTGKITWSPRCLALYGLAPNTPVTLELFLNAIHPDDRKRIQAALRHAVETRSEYAVEKRILRPDGSIRWTASRGRCTYDDAGRPLRMDGVSFDITDRKQAQEALENTGKQLRALAKHLQTVRENERVRLAREVHDEFGHAFTYLKFDLAWLARRLKELRATGATAIHKRIAEMTRRVERDLDSVRRIVTELRPAILDTLGLGPAMEWAAKQFEDRTRIACKLDLRLGASAVDAGRSTALFRIFQEILANVARHAKASRVRVSMRIQAGWLLLKVSDNGRAITQQQIAKPNAMGLLGMRERAIEFGGEMDIHGLPGKGTTVTVAIPLDKTAP